ncbi:MAG: 30S ribosome-binding factor RbfA [Candidatus Omnitrophica bacterium]|nr:30S ribosome-binding factor RbfA [Candidatus Omnitrophota bacterium]
MQGRRIDRVGHLIQMELGRILLMRGKDPRFGLITVTHVNVSPDLKTARVYFTALSDNREKKETAQVLNQASGFFQREIANTLKLRYTPKLEFVFDESIDRGIEIDRVLRKLDEERREN